MDKSWAREKWVDCLIIAFLIFLIFLLLMTPFFTSWFAYEIPDGHYRTITAGFIILGISFLIAGIIITKRDRQWLAQREWWKLSG